MRTLAIVLVAGLVRAASAQDKPESGAPTPAPTRPVAEDARSAAAPRLSGANLLRLRFASVDLSEVTLREAFEWLAEVTRTNVIVRWDMLSAAGVEEDALVSIRARNLRLGQVLWMILNLDTALMVALWVISPPLV